MRGFMVSVVAATIAAGLFGTPAAAAPGEGVIVGAGAAGAIGGKYIVVLKPEAVSAAAAPSTADWLADLYDGDVEARFSRTLRGFAVEMTEQHAKRLAAHPSVAYVQQDGVVSLAGTQTGPPWGLDRIDQTSRPLSGDYTYPTEAAGVTAYVLDTGIRTTHTEFGGRARSGYDFTSNDPDASDCHGHGTHVAGTIGGTTYGVAKSVQLVGVRVLDCTGSGSYSDIIAGVEWVTVNAVRPAVANLSLGGGTSAAVDQAVQASIASGITYAVAAGNENTDACDVTPARTPEAITVGATDSADGRASFSNYGTCLDLFAPGASIRSAVEDSDTASAIMSGTSMATPHVAGVAALYLATHGSATPAQVRDALVAGAVEGVVTGTLNGSPNRLLNTGPVAAPAPEPAPAPAPDPAPAPPALPVIDPLPAPPAPVPPPPCNVGFNGTDMTIRDRGVIASPIYIGPCGGRASRWSRVEVHILHPRRGDVVVELVAPNGRTKRLKASSRRDARGDVHVLYTVNLSTANRTGMWKLRVRDQYRGNVGFLDSWTIIA